MHFYLQPLSPENLFLLFSISLLIIIAYITQEENIKRILLKKYDLLQYDILKSEILFTFKNPKLAKFYLYPAMWVLLSIAIITVFLFPSAQYKFMFYILALALLIQNYMNYNFILDTAIEMERSNKTVDEVLKEKEWFVMRDNKLKTISNEELNNFLKKHNLNKVQNLNKLKFKKDKDSTYYENSQDLYEVYKSGDKFIVDKLELLLSPTFNQLYKPVDLSIKYRNSFLEAIFVIITLYLAISMRG